MTAISASNINVIAYAPFSELDIHCITERIAAMSYPADGLESAFKNHIDDISATIELKHSNKVRFGRFRTSTPEWAQLGYKSAQ